MYPLVVDGLSVTGTIEKAQEIINDDHLSDSDSAVVKDLILVADIMKDRLSKNSKNSSQPPSQDDLKDKNDQKKPKPNVTIQQILTAVHKFKQFSIKQHDQSIHCFNSMLSTGHQI